MKKDFKFFEKLGTIYIARIVYIEFRYMMAFFPPRSVHCILCRGAAELKHTKTLRLMLRCDNCGMLLFANRMFSQEMLRNLPDFQQPYRRFY
jgi:hypothetical protein